MGVFPGLFPLPAEACKITLTFAVQDYLRRGAGCQFGTFVFVRRGMGREEKLSVLDQVRDFDHQSAFWMVSGSNGSSLFIYRVDRMMMTRATAEMADLCKLSGDDLIKPSHVCAALAFHMRALEKK